MHSYYIFISVTSQKVIVGIYNFFLPLLFSCLLYCEAENQLIGSLHGKVIPNFIPEGSESLLVLS